MTALAFLLWAIELVLEVLGARRAGRIGLRPLSTFLGFRAFADVVACLVLFTAGDFFYAWTWYLQALVQYLLFAVVVMFLIARLLRADRYTLRFYSSTAVGLMGTAIFFFHARPFTMPNVLHFAAGTYMLLGVSLCMALVTHRDGHWTSHGIAALVLAASNGLLSALQAACLPVTEFYPLGEILALGIWLWAMRERREVGPAEIRMPLGTRVQASITLDTSSEGMVQ